MNKAYAIIGKPGSWSSEIFKTELEEIHQAIVDIIPISELKYSTSNNSVYWKEMDLAEYQNIYIKKLGAYEPKLLDWLGMLEEVEARGVKFVSSPSKIKKMISRISCTKHLAAAGIPMPKTLITESVEDAIQFIEENNGAVFKPNFSTKAEGMEVIKATEATAEKLKSLIKHFGILYLQELLDLGGRDHGLAFCNGEFIGAYSRVSGGKTWNTTTRDGGHYEPLDPTQEMIELARKAQSVFNLDFCSVDIAESNGQLYVFEVSAFGGFAGLKKGAGINAARIISNSTLHANI